MKNFYLIFAIAGTIVPYWFFGTFFLEYGLNLYQFVSQLFVNSPSSGFTSDLLITSTAFWIWAFCESRIHGIRNWWIFVALTLTVGLSCALPLFLYLRQCAIEKLTAASPWEVQLPTPVLTN